MDNHDAVGGHQALVTRLQRAAEGFRACARVLELLTRMIPHTEEGEAMAARSAALEKTFNDAVTLHGQALEDVVRHVESEVLAFERELETFDRRLPMHWFRENFDPSTTSSVALADYGSLLARHVGDSTLRLDRVQFVFTRVIAFFVRPADATPERRRALLAEALPPVAVDPEARATAVAFLRDAARRVASFRTVSELTGSGFFVDVGGYKISLREKLLDPEVMSAAIELNSAVTETIHRLAGEGGVDRETLKQHLREADGQIRSIFRKLRVDETATQQQFDDWVARSRAREQAKKPAPKVDVKVAFSAPTPVRASTWRKLAAGALLVAAVVLFFRADRGGGLEALSDADLARLSPLLVEGGVAPPDAPMVFVGRIDKAKWALLSLEDRKKAAEALAQSLTGRGLAAGTVMLEDTVVVQIEAGKPLLVQ